MHALPPLSPRTSLATRSPTSARPACLAAAASRSTARMASSASSTGTAPERAPPSTLASRAQGPSSFAFALACGREFVGTRRSRGRRSMGKGAGQLHCRRYLAGPCQLPLMGPPLPASCASNANPPCGPGLQPLMPHLLGSFGQRLHLLCQRPLLLLRLC